MSAANTTKDGAAKSALILDGHQWQGIVKQLNPGAETTARKEKEHEYEEYLKNGSRAMTKHWTNSVEKIREREYKRLMGSKERKKADDERCFRELKELDEKTRKEQIAYAEQLLKRLQAGPKQLEGAFAFSKILHEQQMQREARRARESAERERTLREAQMIRMQAQQWIEDQVEQMRRYRERCAAYKRHVCEDIEARTRAKASAAQLLAEVEQRERDASERQLNERLAKERETSQQRREQFRTEVLKSMQRAKQEKRKLMAKAAEEQRKNDAYNERKHSEEAQRRRDEMLRQRQRIVQRHQLATALFERQPDVEGHEDECYRRAVDELAAQWKQRQISRKQHLERMRRERIEAHAREVERIRQQKEAERRQRSADVQNRHNNDALDLIHECQRRAERARQVKELKELIRTQIEARQKWEREQVDRDRASTNRVIHDTAEQEDETFLSYANKLVNAAKENGRPIFPLVKVIRDYQKQHRLLPPKSDLPHLKSNVKLLK